MQKLNNTMEIFKLLPKTNCRQCYMPTCLAFAAAVFKGEKQLSDCPFVEAGDYEPFDPTGTQKVALEKEQQIAYEKLKERISTVDFEEAAARINATVSGDKLAVRCLGKLIHVDRNGNLSSDIHIHHWIAAPVLNYVLNCQGKTPVEKWVPMRELPSGPSWGAFFSHRCEKPIQKIADEHTELFSDLMEMFAGRAPGQMFDADVALVLHPLPLVPILICYWKPEEGLASELKIFFDRTAEENLNIESIWALATGFAIMLEKLALRHGWTSTASNPTISL